MGHNRIAYLPKSKKWATIVRDVAAFKGVEVPGVGGGGSAIVPSEVDKVKVAAIADQTLANVRYRFAHIDSDSGVIAAFRFMVLLVHATGRKNPSAWLKEHGVELAEDFGTYDVGRALQDYVQQEFDSTEYGTVAIQSLFDALQSYLRQGQDTLRFEFDTTSSFETLRKGTDAGLFCELSRQFFSNFTERYLRYFLEREASRSIESVTDRELFLISMHGHVQDLSRHAFETAKITQSFAAGWYNKHVKDTLPTERRLKGWVSFSFSKINSELTREGIA